MSRTLAAYRAQVDKALDGDEPTELNFPAPLTVAEAKHLASLYQPGEWGHEEVDAIIGAMCLLAEAAS